MNHSQCLARRKQRAFSLSTNFPKTTCCTKKILRYKRDLLSFKYSHRITDSDREPPPNTSRFLPVGFMSPRPAGFFYGIAAITHGFASGGFSRNLGACCVQNERRWKPRLCQARSIPAIQQRRSQRLNTDKHKKSLPASRATTRRLKRARENTLQCERVIDSTLFFNVGNQIDSNRFSIGLPA